MPLKLDRKNAIKWCHECNKHLCFTHCIQHFIRQWQKIFGFKVVKFLRSLLPQWQWFVSFVCVCVCLVNRRRWLCVESDRILISHRTARDLIIIAKAKPHYSWEIRSASAFNQNRIDSDARWFDVWYSVYLATKRDHFFCHPFSLFRLCHCSKFLIRSAITSTCHVIATLLPSTLCAGISIV